VTQKTKDLIHVLGFDNQQFHGFDCIINQNAFHLESNDPFILISYTAVVVGCHHWPGYVRTKRWWFLQLDSDYVLRLRRSDHSYPQHDFATVPKR